MTRWLRLTATLTLLAAGCATVEPRPSDLPTRDVTLADWSLTSIAEVGWARLGVLDATPRTLIVYGIDEAVPDATSVAAGRASSTPRPPSETFVLARYADDQTNTLGGQFNVFARLPATANVGVDWAAGASGGDDRGLVFAYRTAPGGFAGFWIHLFETGRDRASRVYLDTRALRWLTFEVRGATGDEQLLFRVADRAWEAREDAATVGSIAEFAEHGRVTTAWQRVWIPLARLGDGVSRDALASLVFLAESGASEVAFRNLAFTVDREAPEVPPSAHAHAKAAVAEVSQTPPQSRAPVRAMWVWETQAIASDPAELDAFTALVATQKLTDVFVQIPYIQAPGEHWSRQWDAELLGRIVDRMSEIGVHVHALDGAPYYALEVWHPRVVQTARSVVAFNQGRPASRRVHGLRFDIEPYLLDAFQGRGKEAVLRAYFALLDTLRPIAHAAGLRLGVDVPFWFDAHDEITGLPTAAVDGRPASEGIMDRVDDVGLMAYRTSAYGADGLLAHISEELAYAEKTGKPVLVGVETYPLPNETIYGFPGPADPQTPQAHVVVEALGDGRARLTLVDGRETRRDGGYTWATPGARVLGATHATAVPAAKLTFAEHCPADLARLLRRVDSAVGHRPGFGGYIIHSYTSFKRWIDRTDEPGPCHARTSSVLFAP